MLLAAALAAAGAAAAAAAAASSHPAAVPAAATAVFTAAGIAGFVYTNAVTTARPTCFRGKHGGYRDAVLVALLSPVLGAAGVVAAGLAPACWRRRRRRRPAPPPRRGGTTGASSPSSPRTLSASTCRT